MPDLVCSHLTKRYRDVVAVDDVSLTVADGEFLVMLGASGSGKSTMLRLLSGVEPPDSGEIVLGGRRVDELLARQRDVAMVFQSYALYGHMTVRRNLSFPLRCARVPRHEIDARVAEVAEMLSITHLLDRRPAQLSGGQQQRVALGRAIVRRPALFLMDEPLSNLDAKLRARTRLELARLHRQLGVTTVYVTHDQVEALTMGDRIAVLDEGVLRQVASPDELYNYPADVVVAEFVGSPPMNLLPVQLHHLDGGRVRLVGSGFELDVTLDVLDPRVAVAAQEPTTRDVTVGVRPEHLRLCSPCDPAAVSRGGVQRVELLGSERVVWVELEASPERPWAVRVPSTLRQREGIAVGISISPVGVRIFPALGGPQGAHGARGADSAALSQSDVPT